MTQKSPVGWVQPCDRFVLRSASKARGGVGSWGNELISFHETVLNLRILGAELRLSSHIGSHAGEVFPWKRHHFISHHIKNEIT